MNRRTALLALSLAGCGGNWSNNDIAYATAVPRRFLLQVPTIYERGADAGGGMILGQPSAARAAAATAALRYNALLTYLLSPLDVAVNPPTSRTTTSRIWGPFDDANNPGSQFWVDVSSDLADANAPLTWTLKTRGTSGTTWTAGSGTFQPSASAAFGTGSMDFALASVRPLDAGTYSEVQSLRLSYELAPDSHSALSMVESDPGGDSGWSPSGYGLFVRADNAIRWRFSAPYGDVASAQFEVGMLPTGAGVAVLSDPASATRIAVACWNQDGTVSYHAEGSDAGSGAVCPLIPSATN